MKKRFVCGSAALLLTGLSAAMFSLAVSHSHEQARSALDTMTLETIETVVVERDRYLAVARQFAFRRA